MIVGRDNLIKLFPNFAEDVQENGIDLRVGKIYEIEDDYPNRILGCIDDKKFLPALDELDVTYLNDKEVYVLQPKTFYFAKIDREIQIPHNYTQTYLIRSTFSRCGLVLMSSVGDDGFNGTLMMGLYNTNKNVSVFVGANERIIQALTFENDGSASQYEGSYQNNDIYEL